MNILKSLKEIIIVFILQYLFLIIGASFYYFLGYNLDNYISSVGYFILVIFNIILILYLNYKYKIINNKYKIKFAKYFPYVYFVISYSLIINCIFFIFGLNNNSISNINLILIIFSSCIIGPIVEEFLFRSIFINKLKKFYSNNISIFVSSFFFALFHGSINGFIYAFILGIILAFIYIRTNDIKICIFAHMFSNLFVLFLFKFNLYIFLFSICGFCLSGYLIYKFKLK